MLITCNQLKSSVTGFKPVLTVISIDKDRAVLYDCKNEAVVNPVSKKLLFFSFFPSLPRFPLSTFTYSLCILREDNFAKQIFLNKYIHLSLGYHQLDQLLN